MLGVTILSLALGWDEPWDRRFLVCLLTVTLDQESSLSTDLQWVRKVFRPLYIFHSVSLQPFAKIKTVHFICHQCTLSTPSWHKKNQKCRNFFKFIKKEKLKWTQLSISGETWKWLSTNVHHPTWRNWRGSARKNGRGSPNPGVKNLLHHSHEDSWLY